VKFRPDLLLDLAAVAGLTIVAVGLWWIYPPAGVIFTGLAVVAIAWMVAKLWTSKR
jgi:hypothetical protein